MELENFETTPPKKYTPKQARKVSQRLHASVNHKASLRQTNERDTPHARNDVDMMKHFLGFLRSSRDLSRSHSSVTLDRSPQGSKQVRYMRTLHAQEQRLLRDCSFSPQLNRKYNEQSLSVSQLMNTTQDTFSRNMLWSEKVQS